MREPQSRQKARSPKTETSKKRAAGGKKDKKSEDKPKNFKVKVWVYMNNCGDGSARPIFFGSAEAAERYAENDDERFCDDIHHEVLEFTPDGKLVGEPTRDDD